MFSNDDIDAFMHEIGDDAAALIDKVGKLEEWPSDDSPDVYPELERIGKALADPEKFKRLHSVDPVALLGLLATVKLTRSIRLLKELGDNDIELIRKISSTDVPSDEERTLFLKIVFARLSYITRVNIMARLFDPERRNMVFNALID